MHSLLKTLSFAGLFLCAASFSRPLAAQIVLPVFTAPTAVPSVSTAKPQKPAVLDSAPPNRLYVGTVTRTGPSGQTTTGSLEMTVAPDGQVTANLTYNGKTHPYYGVVKPTPFSTNDASVTPRRRTGTFSTTYVFDATATNTVVGLFQEASLTVTASKAYGGTVPGTEHSTLSFTANRLNLGGVVFGTTPVSGSLRPLVPGTGNGG